MDLAIARDSFSLHSALHPNGALLPLPYITRIPCGTFIRLGRSIFTRRRSSANYAHSKNCVSFRACSLQEKDAVKPTLAALASPPSVEETNLLGATNNLVKSLEKVEVLDLSGNKVQLPNLWKDRIAVIGFARHFGCILCRKRADILASKKNDMDAAKVSLILIGPGNVDQARVFVQQTNFPGEVYADPSHAAYESLEFVSSLSSTFTPKGAWRLVTAHVEGYRQDWALSFQKDTILRGGGQQGGILVAGPGIDRIIYLHKDKEAGDDPNIEEIHLCQKACYNV
ncbi:hypothetical protein O6H91_14G041500 [Diphasiastrum complanatum]|uniref:Uncharacterized protein n=1 Tax=Diphasiastrum complanatum TaxID=34168 RepID=A0ACC2BNT0_DIPCM|nr:hypothetical protein O6H91_14G041500 [Diphasiastrum complanatum]